MPLPRYVVLEKRIGQTPLEAIEEWRLAHPKHAQVSATYAGRLDPMASGKLLVLLGDECRKPERYTGLDKEYEVEIVLDISTDTGDALGLPSASPRETHPVLYEIRQALRPLTGTHTIPYPAFSSKTVGGRPLFEYALAGTLDSIVIPEHEETIYRAKTVGLQSVTVEELRERVRERLEHVPRSDEPSKASGSDFRQDEIRAGWKSLLDSLPPERRFTLIMIRVSSASGTYMRTLAERLGAALATNAFALSIHRTKIGRYLRFGPLGLWSNEYR